MMRTKGDISVDLWDHNPMEDIFDLMKHMNNAQFEDCFLEIVFNDNVNISWLLLDVGEMLPRIENFGFEEHFEAVDSFTVRDKKFKCECIFEYEKEVFVEKKFMHFPSTLILDIILDCKGEEIDIPEEFSCTDETNADKIY
mmetsp:Transcript_15765/g.13412  ORF Transcript_15765/g.13412 Transcript_15765/m.13412 type:complete len:141 (+) Transcript_15765:91-513(+)